MKKCYCGQDNADAAVKCSQCGGTEFMGQGNRPVASEPPPLPKATATAQKPVTGTSEGHFNLREKADAPGAIFHTVANSLGGVRRGLLVVGDRQLVLKQRLTGAGKFLLGVIFFLPTFLLILDNSPSPAVENLKAIALIVLLVATFAVPTAYALWLRRYRRELNVAEMTGCRVDDGELELDLKIGSAGPAGSPGRRVELAFKPEAAADLPALQRLLTEWGVPVREDVSEELATFQEHFTAATSRAWVTIALIVTNALVFILMIQSGGKGGGTGNLNLLQWGADYGPLSVNDQQWWRLLACCFLHASFAHIAFNMYALYQAGSLTEKLLGNWFYLAVYLASGLAGSLTSLWFNPDAVSVGASGAIFGVYGALLAYLLRERAGLPRKVLGPVFSSAIVFVLWNFVSGFLSLTSQYTSSLTASAPHHSAPVIDMAAHGGGLVAGFILGFLAARPLAPERRRALTANRRLALAAGICVVLGLLILPVLQANPLDAAKMKLLAGLYARGEGVPKDQPASMRWLQRAADTGDGEAQAAMGDAYYRGDGFGQDYAAAAQWFTKAADQNNTIAERALMFMNFTGQNGPTNNVAGAKWLGKLADQGADQNLAPIERNIGLAYYTGSGLPQDRAEGVKWLKRAAGQGDKDAQEALREIGGR